MLFHPRELLFFAAFGCLGASQLRPVPHCFGGEIGGDPVKALLLVGVLLVVLGIFSFFIPVPHSERHGVNLGDAHVGITTQHDEKVSPTVSIILVVVGAGLMLAGRKS